LRDERDVRAQLRDREVAGIDSSNEHLPAGWVVEAGEEIEE
jgi:hypothetical protein